MWSPFRKPNPASGSGKPPPPPGPETTRVAGPGEKPRVFSRGGEFRPVWEIRRREALQGVPLLHLTEELVARLRSGEKYDEDDDWILGDLLQQELEAAFDYHNNRYGPRRYYDLLRPVLAVLPRSRFAGATVVDLGCGSVNPFAFTFLLLSIGAERAYGVDIDPIQDWPRAAKALATCAAWMLVASRRLLDPDRVPPEEVLRNLRGFDLSKLGAGDPAGIDRSRLVFLQDSVYDMSLRDGEADVVFSNSFLEHLDRIEDLLESFRRVTKPGGYGHHLVDFSDHRIYPGLVASPFEFLKLDTRDEIVFGSNRLRCGQLCALFEKHGFDVERVETARHASLSPADQAQLVEPFRSMDREDLERICARILVRRR
ncbi:MAG TPA: methyltransferase domain-containing protein [Planctomycetota bacterium]|jgi:SAM-dependent methyltransferase|nr:methyltransferase domain-containing protein [Planctomycetota bacterium]